MRVWSVPRTGACAQLTRSLSQRSAIPRVPTARGRETAKPDACVTFTVPACRDDDYDWLVVGSGFGGSVSALRLREKGYRVGVLECGRRFADEDFPRSTWDLRRYFWAPRLGHARDLPAVDLQGRRDRQRRRRRRRLARLREHALPRARRRFYEDPQWAGLRRLGDRARAALRRGGADARRRRRTTRTTRPTSCCASSAREIGVEDTYAKTRVGVFFGDAGRDGARPVLRRRRARSAPAACCAGAAWSAARTAPRTRWSRTTCGSPSAPAPRCCPSATVVDVRPLGARRRLGGLRGDHRAPRRVAARATAARSPPAASWSPPARSAPTSCSPRCQLARLAAARLGPRSASSCARTRRRSSRSRCPRDAPDMTRARRDHRLDLPRPRHAHRDRHLRRRGDSMSALYTLLVGDGTRVTRPLKLLGAARAPPAARSLQAARPARLVAPHDHRARDADARQRDRAAARRARARRRAAADRAGPRAAEPDVHPGRQPVRRVAGEAHRRHRAELA